MDPKLDHCGHPVVRTDFASIKDKGKGRSNSNNPPMHHPPPKKFTMYNPIKHADSSGNSIGDVWTVSDNRSRVDLEYVDLLRGISAVAKPARERRNRGEEEWRLRDIQAELQAKAEFMERKRSAFVWRMRVLYCRVPDSVTAVKCRHCRSAVLAGRKRSLPRANRRLVQ